MKSYVVGLLLLVGFAVGLGCAGVVDQHADNVQTHIAAARAAAGQEHKGLFDRVCTFETEQPTASQSKGPPDRSKWHAEPVKVFDNLYFVGQTEYSAWDVTTSDGIIVVDALWDYSVEDEVVNGLKKLGLDPAKIKYVLVSHGHIDHAGGAKLLQDRFGARVILSAADWDLLDRNKQSWPKPKRDMVATDGQRLTLGDTTLTLYLTPGHTPGTISTLIPVKDSGKPHLVAEWGGTAFNFTITPDKPRKFWFRTYSDSAKRFRDIVTKSGADALIANHRSLDRSTRKLAALANRKAGPIHM